MMTELKKMLQGWLYTVLSTRLQFILNFDSMPIATFLLPYSSFSLKYPQDGLPKRSHIPEQEIFLVSDGWILAADQQVQS